MVDPIFASPRLAAVYDQLEPDRRDLSAYMAMADEFQATSVLDIGCGTGAFACLLVGQGNAVTAVDPAAASLVVARAKRGADQVRWIHGYATDLPPMAVDLATMTGNVAQVFVTDEEWAATLRAAFHALRPGGRLIFETRDPAAEAWLHWTGEHTHQRTVTSDLGVVQRWYDVTDVHDGLVSFRATFVFESDGARLTSDSTLRFRTRHDIALSLEAAGYLLDEVRDAPDRASQEMIFVARRPDST
jgi:SAM-dependent methyltransferase